MEHIHKGFTYRDALHLTQLGDSSNIPTTSGNAKGLNVVLKTSEYYLTPDLEYVYWYWCHLAILRPHLYTV